jgi:hypothetical protein
VLASGIEVETKWACRKHLQNLANQLTKGTFQVNGKVFLKEFVTAGGIDLKEINFKTMENYMKIYFAGENCNIDALADLTFKMHGQVGILWRTLSKTVLTRVYKSLSFI